MITDTSPLTARPAEQDEPFSIGPESGLPAHTLRRYAKSELLERDHDGTPIYMHTGANSHPCDYACNGTIGEKIADDIDRLEGGEIARFDPRI